MCHRIIKNFLNEHGWFMAGLLAAVTFNYGLSLKAGFLIDDLSFIEGVYDYNFTHLKDFFFFNQSQHFSPFYYLWYLFLYRVLASTAALHAVNLFLFALACWACYGTSAMVLKEKRTAWFTALLFALHPVNSLPAINIAQNYFSLFLILMFASVYFFIRALDDEKITSTVLSLVFFLGALLFFEAAILMPVYFLILAFFFKQRPLVSSFKKTLPAGMISLLYFATWIVMAGKYSGIVKTAHLQLTPWGYLEQVFLLISWYARNLFFPFDLVHILNFRSLPANALLPLGLFGTIFFAGTITLAVRLKDRTIAGALLWFLTSLLLVLPASFAHSYMGLVIEPHWMIFGTTGFFIFLVLIFERTAQPLPVFLKRLIVLIFLAILVAATQGYNRRALSQNDYFHFWEQTAPNNPIPVINLGYIAMKQGDDRTAVRYFERALVIGGYHKDAALYNLGVISWKNHDGKKAKNYFYDALLERPSEKSCNYLGKIALAEGNIPEAEKFFRQAVAVDKKYFNGYYNLGHVLMLKKQYEPAYVLYLWQFKTFTRQARQRKHVLSRLIVLARLLQREQDAALWLKRWLAEKPDATDQAQLKELSKEFSADKSAPTQHESKPPHL